MSTLKPAMRQRALSKDPVKNLFSVYLEEKCEIENYHIRSFVLELGGEFVALSCVLHLNLNFEGANCNNKGDCLQVTEIEIFYFDSWVCVYTFLLYLKSRLGRKCWGRLKVGGAWTNMKSLIGPAIQKKGKESFTVYIIIHLTVYAMA